MHTHIEPLPATDRASKPASGETAEERHAIEEAVRASRASGRPRSRFRDAQRGRVALVTITLPGDQPLPSAHSHAGRIEEAVRERCPGLADVIVHTEPEPARGLADASPQVDRRRERDREQHARVAQVAREEQDEAVTRQMTTVVAHAIRENGTRPYSARHG